MSQIQKLQGIVIKKIDYKENANLITVLCKDGKMSFIVRGSKKINSVMKNYTNLFTFLEFNATSNLTLNTLTEGTVINSFVNINNSFDKLNVGIAILEKINYLTDEITNTELFYNFVILIFNLLEKTNYPYGVLAVFELKLLYLLGVSPELKVCTLCNSKDSNNAFFSVKHGGVICENHTDEIIDLNENETTSLKLLFYIKPDKIDDEFLKITDKYIPVLDNVIDKFYQRHLDFYSKAKKIIKEIR